MVAYLVIYVTHTNNKAFLGVTLVQIIKLLFGCKKS